LVPRRRVVPRIPQNPLAWRPQTVAGHRTRRRSRGEAGLRAERRTRPGRRACAPFCAVARRPRRRAAHRGAPGAVRYRSGLAPGALASPGTRPALAQAARELLLAQASDWQFMISTGAVPDYAERRFKLHCDDAERLIAAVTSGSSGGGGEGSAALAAELERRDDLFPNVLEAVAEVLGA